MIEDAACREIVRRTLRGDPEAFAEIVNGCQDGLRAAVGGFCKSAAELEDACHRAFVQAYFKLGEYDPERGPFFPWLAAVARNGVYEEFRRRKAEERRLHAYLERRTTPSPVVENVLLAQQALERCLGEIDPAEAGMLRARYGEDRTSDQIGGAVGKTAAAARKMMQRLRERLRVCVERRMATMRES